MNLHEYQGKDILNSFNVNTPKGILAQTPEEAIQAAQTLQASTGCNQYVIKAQIHAGGRGKAGGIKLAENLQQVGAETQKLLGHRLITPQTPASGKQINKVLVCEDVYIGQQDNVQEYYISIFLDRASGQTVIVYSEEGGTDIEHVSADHPKKIFTEPIDPLIGLATYQARKIAFNLNIPSEALNGAIDCIMNLYKAYIGTDATLVEINPLLKTDDNRMVAVDCKMVLDDNALFRHPDYQALRDPLEENPIELKANALGLNYIDLDGNIGCIVNGAGLAMATMDLVKQVGGEPANFLDVGGTANAERIEQGFRILMEDSKVDAILINIFGGIVRCDIVAEGVVAACNNINITIPIVIRLKGTNATLAKQIIDDSGLNVYSAIELKEAADKIQEILKPLNNALRV